MTLQETAIPGCYEITPRIISDDRGVFVKTFHEEEFRQHGLNTEWKEEYYSVSHRGVLRGLHFQLPPHDHEKMVFCTVGVVLDVVVDLRRGSSSYGQYVLLELSAEKGNMLYIPRGLAHGFYVVSETATMMYKVSSVYSPEHDAGILWNSAEILWPDKSPSISQRDSRLPDFARFISPFEAGICRVSK